MTMEPDEIHLLDPDAVLDVTGDEQVDSWRGVKAEDVDEPDSGLAGLLRSRSRGLLGNLVRPHRWSLALAALMIGINTLGAMGISGIGFAVPINTAKQLLPQLKSGTARP